MAEIFLKHLRFEARGAVYYYAFCAAVPFDHVECQLFDSHGAHSVGGGGGGGLRWGGAGGRAGGDGMACSKLVVLANIIA
eukprot:11960553-Ditylum_brightwellii.AAC.1